MAIFIDGSPSSRHARQSLDLACSICFLFSVNLVLCTASRTSHIWVSTLALSCIPGPVTVLLKSLFIEVKFTSQMSIILMWTTHQQLTFFTVLYNFGLMFQDLFITPEGSLLLLSSYSYRPVLLSQSPLPHHVIICEINPVISSAAVHVLQLGWAASWSPICFPYFLSSFIFCKWLLYLEPWLDYGLITLERCSWILLLSPYIPHGCTHGCTT